LRVLLDTNIIVSALAFPGGKPEQIYDLLLAEQFEHVTCPEVLGEVTQVLTRKLQIDPRKVAAAVIPLGQISTVTSVGRVSRVVAADPDDDIVLAAAERAHAEVIVSGDQHRLALESWRKVQIQSAAAFLLGRE